MRARVVGIGTLALALACGGGPDTEALETIADAVSTIDPSRQGQILLAGLAEPDVGVVNDACAAKLYTAVTTTDAALRAMTIAEAFSGTCPDSCAQEAFEALATMDPHRKTALAVEVCGESGPDPVFGAASLSAIRPEMDTMDYLVGRMLLEPALAATEGTEVGKKYTDLLESVAVSFVVNGSARVQPAAAGGTTELYAGPNLDKAAATDVVGRAGLTCGWGTARLVVAADGHVRAAAAARQPLGALEGDGQCVAEGLIGARFPATTDGGLAVVDVAWAGAPVELHLGVLGADGLEASGILGVLGAEGVGGFGGLGDLPGGGVNPNDLTGTENGTPRPAGPTVTTAKAEVQGSLSADAIKRVMMRHMSKIRYCYEKQLQIDPAAAGRTNVRFVIAADGTVSSADVTSETLPEAVTMCVSRVIQQMQFPEPDGGGIVSVSYPFTFSPE